MTAENHDKQEINSTLCDLWNKDPRVKDITDRLEDPILSKAFESVFNSWQIYNKPSTQKGIYYPAKFKPSIKFPICPTFDQLLLLDTNKEEFHKYGEIILRETILHALVGSFTIQAKRNQYQATSDGTYSKIDRTRELAMKIEYFHDSCLNPHKMSFLRLYINNYSIQTFPSAQDLCMFLEEKIQRHRKPYF